MIADESVELIYACHVLEYFDREEVGSILEEWNRTLVPDGILRVAVPNFEVLIKAYRRFGQLDLIHGPLYGRWEVGDRVLYHRTVYNFATLRETLESAGFYGVCKYDWRETIHRDYDDYSQAYLPHMDKEEGLLISLNVECKKLVAKG
jgi:predicted SAM-dependent methyltransferase